MKSISLALLIAALALWGCATRRPLVLEMEWSNDALWYPARPLPAGAFRLTFPTAPNVHIAVDAPSLLRQLQLSGRQTVSVQFDVKCDVWRKRSIGYTVISVDNILVPGNADGWTESTGNTSDPTNMACQ